MANQDTSFIKHVDDATFDAMIKKGIVLIDFFAEWCGPCHMQTPILETVAKDVAGQATIAKIDIDQNQNTTAQFRVTSIPTMILFKNGVEVKRIVGLRDAETLKEMIKAAV